MNNLLKLGVAGVMAAGFLTGCGASEAKDKGVKVKQTEEIKSRSVSAAEVDPKEWKDKSSANGLEKIDFSPTAKGWVADKLNIFRQEPDSELLEAGYDKGYDYYLKAYSVSNVLGSYIWVEGVDIQKDFENLRLLTNIIIHESDVRSAGTNSIKEWKPISQSNAISL